MVIRNKKAAFEMSVTTMIVIVLSVVFLILALAFIRNIFGSATDSINVINDQVMDQLRSLFTNENQKVLIKLPDSTAKIRAGSANFGIAVAARTLYGNSPGGYDGIQYKLELSTSSDCYQKLGQTLVEKWFIAQTLSNSAKGDAWNSMDRFDSVDLAGSSIKITIPDGTIQCTQQVKILFVDNTQTQKALPIGGDTFTIQILRKSLI